MVRVQECKQEGEKTLRNHTHKEIAIGGRWRRKMKKRMNHVHISNQQTHTLDTHTRTHTPDYLVVSFSLSFFSLYPACLLSALPLPPLLLSSLPLSLSPSLSSLPTPDPPFFPSLHAHLYICKFIFALFFFFLCLFGLDRRLPLWPCLLLHWRLAPPIPIYLPPLQLLQNQRN